MEGISSGFQTTSNEALIFVLLLGAIAVGLIIAQIARRHALAKQARKRAESPRKPILRSYSHPSPRDRLNLAPREQATLNHLTWLLKDPSKPERLLQDDSMMLRTARQAIREGVVTEAEALRLLRRLGIDPTPLARKGQVTSATIPTGAEVSISSPAMAMGTGEVLLSTDTALQLRIDKGAARFKAGDAVDAICYSDHGMHQFHTTVAAVKGKNIALRHTPHVRQAQRRRHRRREVGMSLQFTVPGVDAKPVSTTTLDLSIGGAAIKNPRKRLTEGAFLECSLDAGSGHQLQVRGTVVRLSRRRKVAHLTFAPMDEKTRHRLFRRLIRGG